MTEESKPLNIGLIQRGSVDWTGGIELEKNLVEATLRYARAEGKYVRFVLFGQGGRNDHGNSIAGDVFGKVEFAEWPPPARAEKKRTRVKKWLKRLLTFDPKKEEAAARRELRLREGRYLGELGIDFLYPPFKIPAGYKMKSAAWLCDFQHKYLPEYFGESELKQRNHLFGAIASRANTVVVSSETAVRHFREFYPDSKANIVSLPFRVIIPSSLYDRNCVEVVNKYNLPERFFIVCNQFWKHKNHAVVLDAVEELASEGVDCRIVMTGRFHDDREPLYTDRVLADLRRRGLSDRVVILGLVPKEDQLQLLRAAIAVIQPSFFEGWSTIVEESHALGTDIILSDLPVHREQNHPSATFFDPTDTGQLSEAMRKALEGSPDGCSVPNSDYPDLVTDFGRRFYELAASRS